MDVFKIAGHKYTVIQGAFVNPGSNKEVSISFATTISKSTKYITSIFLLSYKISYRKRISPNAGLCIL